MQLGPLHSTAPEDHISILGKRLPWVAEYTYLGLELTAGPDLLRSAILNKCAKATACCRTWQGSQASRVQNRAQETRTVFITEIAARRDYALHAVRLEGPILQALIANEQLCLQILRCKLQGGDRLWCRLRDRRAKLERNLKEAPCNSWRKLLLDASRPWTPL